MADSRIAGIPPETAIHRIGGGAVRNLRLKRSEEGLTPPGFSVLLGGTAAEAAAQMRQAFPDPGQYTRLHEEAKTVGTTTAQEVREAGFEVVAFPTKKFPNHARITHADGVAGFTEENLERLSRAFRDTAVEEK